MAGDKDDKKKDKGEAKPKKDKADKPDKGEKHAKGEGGDKSAKAEGKGKGGGEKKGEGKGKAPKSTAPEGGYKRTGPPRLKAFYAKEVVANLMKDFKYVNQMQVPRLQKISVNIGLGEAAGNPKLLDTAVEEMRAITGQQPVVTKAKKAIANFKLREGQKIGVMVTLRREKMWEFLERLVSLALPRVRDFKGVSPRAFDGRGNFSLGIREQIIFPEINYDKIDKIKGFNVSIVTSAKTDEEGRALLRYLGMPFRQ